METTDTAESAETAEAETGKENGVGEEPTKETEETSTPMEDNKEEEVVEAEAVTEEKEETKAEEETGEGDVEEEPPTPADEKPPVLNGESHVVEEESKTDVMSVTSPETPNNPIAAMLSQVLTEEKRKPDPCVEVVEDLKVKIADLGNACWVSWAVVG